jgi:anti-sigma B factor antagonist
MDPRHFDAAEYVTVTVTSLHSVTVVEVSGEIDAATRYAMAEPVFEQLDGAPPDLLLDLSKIRFMGSAGLAVLLEAHNRCRQGNTRLAIVAPDHSVVLRTLTISGLVELLPIHRTVADALRAIPGGQALRRVVVGTGQQQPGARRRPA